MMAFWSGGLIGAAIRSGLPFASRQSLKGHRACNAPPVLATTGAALFRLATKRGAIVQQRAGDGREPAHERAGHDGGVDADGGVEVGADDTQGAERDLARVGDREQTVVGEYDIGTRPRQIRPARHGDANVGGDQRPPTPWCHRPSPR